MGWYWRARAAIYAAALPVVQLCKLGCSWFAWSPKAARGKAGARGGLRWRGAELCGFVREQLYGELCV